MNEPFNPQEEVEKLCEEHKIFFTGKGNVTHENLISVGLGNLLYNQLSQFVDKKENNGFYILEIKNPETKQKYNIEIKYEGGEEPNVPEKNENKKKEKKFLIWVEKFNSYVVDIESVADYFCKKYKFVTVSNSGKEKLYMFNGKFYEENARAFIKEEFEKLLGKYAKISPLNEVIAKIERKNYLNLEDFEKTDINLIPFGNGIFNIQEKKLEPHSSDNYFKTIIPVNYIPSEKCPIFLKFLEEALYPEDIPVIQEWFGFNLYRKYLIKKALICLGGKNTGKTILLNSLISLIGEKNKTGLSLQKLSYGSDFIKLSLKDKYANVYDDLSSKDLNDGGNFKIATGGGFISAEEKFGGYYQFKSFAKQTFATNKIPPVKDNDDMAYFSRWIVIRFDNVPEKKDLFLGDKINKELSGILNWALEGLFRLLDLGKFSYNKTDEEIKDIMEMSGDPLIQFGAEVLEQSESRVSKEQMYEIYSIWAKERAKPLLSKEQLGRRLNLKIRYLLAKNDTHERFWDNVSINKEWVKKMKNSQNILNIDTFDTFKKNMSLSPEVLEPSYDIIISKVSKVSKDNIEKQQDDSWEDSLFK